MIRKVVAWVRALFAPAKIEDVKVDEYIATQKLRAAGESGIGQWSRHMEKAKVEEVVTPKKAEPTPPKPLNEQMKGVELPSYAKGRTLPPKAKRNFIKQAKSEQGRKCSTDPAGYGMSQINPQ